MNRSIGFRTHPRERTSGSSGRATRSNGFQAFPLCARRSAAMAAWPLASSRGRRPVIGLTGKVAGDELEQVRYAIAVAVFIGNRIDPRRDARRLIGSLQLGSHGLESLAKHVVRPRVQCVCPFVDGHVTCAAVVELAGQAAAQVVSQCLFVRRPGERGPPTMPTHMVTRITIPARGCLIGLTARLNPGIARLKHGFRPEHPRFHHTTRQTDANFSSVCQMLIESSTILNIRATPTI